MSKRARREPSTVDVRLVLRAFKVDANVLNATISIDRFGVFAFYESTSDPCPGLERRLRHVCACDVVRRMRTAAVLAASDEFALLIL